MAVQDVTDENFAEVVLGAQQPVLVDYWAEWCGPCKQLSPVLAELSEIYGDRMKFVQLDADANPIAPADHFVQGLPTVQIFDGGELVKSFRGSKPRATYVTAIESSL